MSKEIRIPFEGTKVPGLFDERLKRTFFDVIVDGDDNITIKVGEKSRTPRLIDILEAVESLHFQESAFSPEVHTTKNGQSLVFSCAGQYFMRGTHYGIDEFVRIGGRTTKIPAGEFLAMAKAICRNNSELSEAI